jgi:hypothetical protein
MHLPSCPIEIRFNTASLETERSGRKLLHSLFCKVMETWIMAEVIKIGLETNSEGKTNMFDVLCEKTLRVKDDSVSGLSDIILRLERLLEDYVGRKDQQSFFGHSKFDMPLKLKWKC